MCSGAFPVRRCGDFGVGNGGFWLLCVCCCGRGRSVLAWRRGAAQQANVSVCRTGAFSMCSFAP